MPLSDEEFEKVKAEAERTRARRWRDLFRDDLSEAKRRQRLNEFSNMTNEHRPDGEKMHTPGPSPNIGWGWTFTFEQIGNFFKRLKG